MSDNAAASATNAELRTMIRGMKPKERNALIDTAVRECDSLIVNAVLGRSNPAQTSSELTAVPTADAW